MDNGTKPGGDTPNGKTGEGQNTRTTAANSRARARRPVKPTMQATTPEAIERWERDYECVKMRRAQCDWDTIVAKLGYASRGHAHDRFVAFLRAYPRDDVAALRDLEADRLEEAGNALWPEIQKGNARAAEVWNKLSERRAKLLGMDAPIRQEVTHLSDSTVDRAIQELRDQMTAEATAAGVELPEHVS
jgi:hypothetical protein